MIWFICVVSIGMVYQRLLCTGGIPYDCASIDHPEDQLDVVNTIILVRAARPALAAGWPAPVRAHARPSWRAARAPPAGV